MYIIKPYNYINNKNLSNNEILKKKQMCKKIVDSFNHKFLHMIPKITHKAWYDIFSITDRSGHLKMGYNFKPKPQLMGYFIELFITKELKNYMPNNEWEFDPTGYSKDIVNIINPRHSIEIKSSSQKSNGIYGNRSYAQPIKDPKKSHDAFYLSINYEPFYNKNKISLEHPHLKLIRFGYLSHKDWKPQKSSSGQAATIPSHIAQQKLIELWPYFEPFLRNKN